MPHAMRMPVKLPVLAEAEGAICTGERRRASTPRDHWNQHLRWRFREGLFDEQLAAAQQRDEQAP